MRASAVRIQMIAVVICVCAWAGVGSPALADSEEAQFNVVVSLYNAGQWQAAVTKIEEREKTELTDAMRSKYLHAKGLAYEKGSKTAEARAAYEQLVTKYPNAAEVGAARVSLIYMDYAKGDADAVLAGYPKIDQSKLNAANKKNIALMYAESLYAKKDEKNAMAAYKAAIAAGNDAAPLAPKLFDLALRLNDNAEVLAQSEKGVAGLLPDVVALTRAEAMLALNRFADADTEAAKVGTNTSLNARASFVRAQALIKQNKLKEAAVQLKVAVAGMKDPPAPPAAHLALAECLLEAGSPDEAAKALDQGEKAIRGLPEVDRAKYTGQISMLRLRTAGTDRKKLIAAATDARATIPKEQLPKVLYLRLFVLSEEKDNKGVVETMKDDYPVLQTSAEDGPATMIYFNALKELKRVDDGLRLLEEYTRRKADTPEASKARLLLAGAALEKGDNNAAKTWFEAIAADAKAPTTLGKNAYDEAMYNRMIVLQKAGDVPAASKAAAALVALKPDAELLRKTLLLQGQLAASQKDYTNASAAWKQALAAAKGSDELELRDRLARVMLASGDNAGAIEQCDAIAKLAGGEEKASRDIREIWARALFATSKFSDAAAKYGSLAEAFKDEPSLAYEAAVAFDRAGSKADALKWYNAAAASKAKLPASYADRIDTAVANARLGAGDGDMGLPYWLEQATTTKDERLFESSIGAIRKIAAKKDLDDKARERLAKAMNESPAENARRYALGAVVLQSMSAARQTKEAGQLADKLAEEFTKNEKKLDAKASGATIAPAMIHFYRGESQRQLGKFADALASYETVLSAYPYNEWPDAAACGAAECFLALGDNAAALQRFKEVAAVTDAGSAKWRELAAKRVSELEIK